jgi:CoA:oxalate CoA-transferase
MFPLLKDIIVLDLTVALSGPFSTQILADFGANVIKIEPPAGDFCRTWGPFVNNESTFFMSCNRGKRSVILNLKSSEGVALFKRMVEKADIVSENFRPGVMERLGLGYDDLKKINPRIIYSATSGFGHTGPLKNKSAYDMVVQAMGGIMSITGPETGEPTRVGPSISDVIGGLYSAIGLMMTLYHRSLTGHGQMIDVAMMDGLVATLENAIVRTLYGGAIPGPVGNRHASIAPFESYMASDQYFVIAVANPKQWALFCECIINRPEMIDDDRFRTNELRLKNLQTLNEIIKPIFRTRKADEWLDLLDSKGIPCGKINNIAQVIDHPQVKAREMIVDTNHPAYGLIKLAGIPIKLSLTPGKVTRPAPVLGEHTSEILRELLSMNEEEITRLVNSNVCGRAEDHESIPKE